MGFMDTLKERFGRNEDYDDYDYEDQDYAGDELDEDAGYSYEPPEPGHGLLGNSSRPRAESVSVYTRTGELIDSNFEGIDHSAPAPYERNSQVHDNDSWTDSRLDYNPADAGRAEPRTAATHASATSASSAASLPAYVLAPISYDDVETVIRRVRTMQPVVLNFRPTNIDIAKRILDFSLGFAAGVGGRVDELGERAFVVLPAGVELEEVDLRKLEDEGIATPKNQ